MSRAIVSSLIDRAALLCACLGGHPGQCPKLEANIRQYAHRLAEADAVAMLSPGLADQLVAKPLRELREELSRWSDRDRAARPARTRGRILSLTGR